MPKITVEELKAFLKDSERESREWRVMAEKSWNEIKKRQSNRKLFSINPNSTRRKSRYPAWYSIFKIRQPLLLSRIGIPIGRDTTQDGNDNIGATAAICLERLATNLVKSFDFLGYLTACRDDFLATDFGGGRAYYEKDSIKEKVKEYITPQKDEMTQDVVFVNGEGEVIESDDIFQDDEGYYIEHSEEVDVDNERICLEPVLYKNWAVDVGAVRWSRVNRVAFRTFYSAIEFKEIFGTQAYLNLPREDQTQGDEAAPKNQVIGVDEYWDKYEDEVLWLAVGGDEFIKPKGYTTPEGYEELGPRKGLYDLEHLFPCTKPMIRNNATDEFWPVPEFYQLAEILDDIHTIFSRMVTLTKAIRTRLMFDSSIEGLQSALNEANESDAIGVSNLTKALSGAGGTIKGVVQYVPVEESVQALNNMYQALEQRLNIVYKLTGTSDLLQGLVTDPTQRTFGERQMQEKYALNQLADPQRIMQEFTRDSYQLVCEMALKNLKDSSLDRYIMPQTLQPEHRQQYQAAMGLLKNDMKRFRIELETDSTIAINEEFDKQMRITLVNALTTALEKTANIAQVSPALIVPELHCLKYLIQGFRQGKLFQSEVTTAIDNVIQQAQAQPAPFNKEQSDFELEQKKLELQFQKTGAEVGIQKQQVQIEAFKANQVAAHDQALLNLKTQADALAGQLAILNFELDKQKAGVEMQNKMADNERLTAEVAYGIQRESQPKAPQVVVVPGPQAAPQAPIIVAPQAAPGPTIINAPNPAPQTSVIQPVQEVPVPIIPGVNI